MKTDCSLSKVWQHDVPQASDMTFVLATLQRIERRRFHRGLLIVLFSGLLATLLLWQSWPLLLQWSEPLIAVVQSMTQLELLMVFVAATVLALLELRVFR